MNSLTAPNILDYNQIIMPNFFSIPGKVVYSENKLLKP